MHSSTRPWLVRKPQLVTDRDYPRNVIHKLVFLKLIACFMLRSALAGSVRRTEGLALRGRGAACPG